MNIGIVSGKGGAGKTLVAINLAYTASKNGKITIYDLDVEEPNLHLFLNDSECREESVKMMIPKVDQSKCHSDGTCTEVCEFNAIINLGKETLIFPELCHSCYACLELCPNEAISETFKEIGKIRTITNPGITLIEGRLNISETASPSLIREVKKRKANNNWIKIFDSPPGTSCSVVEAIKNIDYTVVVCEPTIFGFHDFKLMTDTLKSLRRDFGVVINKYQKETQIIEDYCTKNYIEIIGKIPLSFEIASFHSKGQLIIDKVMDLKSEFEKILNSILINANKILL
jgi:MinD superfamily P-loop ATPase